MSKGAGRVSGLGDSDGPCPIARYTRRRPGIPPPRLRSAPPFDKGGFSRGLRPRKKRPPYQRGLAAPAGLRGFAGLSAAAPSPLCRPIHSSLLTPNSSLLTPPHPLPFPKLYKLYTLYTKPAPSLQNLYRDCTVLWSKPAQNRGTISLLPVKH